MRNILILILVSVCFTPFLHSQEVHFSKDSVTINATAGSVIKDTLFINNIGNPLLTWSMESSLPGALPDTFTKANFADWTIAANQDRVAADVWLTRANDQGLFNYAKETSYATSSPSLTNWSGTITLGAGTYTTWKLAVNSNPTGYIGKYLSLYVISTGKYYDVFCLSFSGGGTGGGISYIRTEKPGIKANIISGTLLKDDSSMLVITYDNTKLTGGTYHYSLIVSSDDPVHPKVTIPITLNIVKKAKITANTITNSIALYKTETFKDTLILSNTGDTSLIWTITKPSWITASSSGKTTLKAKSDSVVLTVDATSIALGEYKDTIRISSNDSLNKVLIFPVSLEVGKISVVKKIQDVIIILSPDTIAVDTAFKGLKGSTLSYSAKVVDSAFFSIKMIGKNLIIDGKKAGSADVIVTASDGIRASAVDTFNVIIMPSMLRNESGNVFSVFPNPACDKVFVKLAMSELSRVLEIFDINGNVVYIKQIVPGLEMVEIDMEKLSIGSYLIKISDSKNIAVGRFIKE